MGNQRKIRWLDACHECRRQNPLQKKKRCELWYAVATNSPMAEKMMDKVGDRFGHCSMFEMKEGRR